MFKKVTAFLLSAVIMAGASTAVYAESIPQTVIVEQEYGASAAKVWDGKTTMKAGQKYVLKKSVTIRLYSLYYKPMSAKNQESCPRIFLKTCH